MSAVEGKPESAETMMQRDAQSDARLTLEERMLGWQLKECPGATEGAQNELRVDALMFQAPLDQVQSAIFRTLDAGRTVSPQVIAAELSDCAALSEIGGSEYLRSLADAAPAIISAEDGRKQMVSAIRTWRRMSAPLPAAGGVELVRGDSVDPKPIDWIWNGWLAAGKFHVFGGQAGTGKTTIAAAIAGALSSGGTFPDGTHGPTGATLIWSGEDDFQDSLLPRFIANGGARDKLHYVKGYRDETGELHGFDPATDLDELIKATRSIPDLKLIIVDPIVSAVSGDSHKNAEVRRSLQPLVRLADETKVALLGITHYSKGTSGRSPLERITGSLAFGALPRLVWGTAKSNDPEEPRRLVRAKSNIGPDGGGFEYELNQVAVNGDASVFGQSVNWGESLEGDAQRLLSELESQDEDGKAPALEAAKVWLTEILGTGEVSVKYLEDMAGVASHAWPTVKRAKLALGVRSHKAGLGGWVWSMPKEIKRSEEAHTQKRDPLHPFEEAHVIPFEEDQEDHPTECGPLQNGDPLRPYLTNGKGAAA